MRTLSKLVVSGSLLMLPPVAIAGCGSDGDERASSADGAAGSGTGATGAKGGTGGNAGSSASGGMGATGAVAGAGNAAGAGGMNEPKLGVYKGAATVGPELIPNYESWLGRPVVYGHDFQDVTQWSGIEGPAWQFGDWAKWVSAAPDKHRLQYTVSWPTKIGMTLSAIASGSYDSHYQTLADHLMSYGLGNASISFFHEFDGGWYEWTAKPGEEANYAAAFRHLVQVMRARQPSNQWTFFLCFAHAWNKPGTGQQIDVAWMESVYPGDDYVDYIGMDFYDIDPTGGTYYNYPTSVDSVGCWQNAHEIRLDRLADFARSHGKKMAFGEVGFGYNTTYESVSGHDNPYGVEQFYNWCHDPENNVEFVSHWDYQAPDFHAQLSPPTEFPNAAAKWQQLWGSL